MAHNVNNSVKFGMFSEKMKIAKFTPISKLGKEKLLTNSSPVLVLLHFSKILKQVIKTSK